MLKNAKKTEEFGRWSYKTNQALVEKIKEMEQKFGEMQQKLLSTSKNDAVQQQPIEPDWLTGPGTSDETDHRPHSFQGYQYRGRGRGRPYARGPYRPYYFKRGYYRQ